FPSVKFQKIHTTQGKTGSISNYSNITIEFYIGEFIFFFLTQLFKVPVPVKGIIIYFKFSIRCIKSFWCNYQWIYLSYMCIIFTEYLVQFPDKTSHFGN